MINRNIPVLLTLLIITFHFFSNSQCIVGDCVQGYGEKIYSDSSIFKGNFDKGKKLSGEYIYASGDIYKGEFKDNLRNGLAEYIYKNGDVFRGFYENDQKRFGVYTYFSSGDQFSGSFKNNQPDGYGTLKKVLGESIEGEWKNGKLIWQNTNQSDSSNIPQTDKSVSKGFVPPKFYCVIIGVSDYSGSTIDLNYADDDAILFTRYLRQAFAQEIRNGKVVQLINSQATKSNILSAIKSVFSQATENDFILFYFSGHGGQGFFVPYDHEFYTLYHSDVREVIMSSPAKYKICIADACFSGGIHSSFAENNAYSSLSTFNDSRLAVLMSSNASQTSLENSSLKQGVFTYSLIKGLKGFADYNKDSYVTIGELFTFTQRMVKNQTNGRQTPIIFGKDLYKIPMSRIRK
jgi:hypothetical protein